MNTGSVHKKSRWCPFVRYSISWAVQYSNGIKKPDHLASTSFRPFENQTSSVFRSRLYHYDHNKPLKHNRIFFHLTVPSFLSVLAEGEDEDDFVVIKIGRPRFAGSVSCYAFVKCPSRACAQNLIQKSRDRVCILIIYAIVP